MIFEIFHFPTILVNEDSYNNDIIYFYSKWKSKIQQNMCFRAFWDIFLNFYSKGKI